VIHKTGIPYLKFYLLRKIRFYLILMNTLFRLGVYNILSVAIYRFLIRLNLHRVQRIKGRIPATPFFTHSLLATIDLPIPDNWKVDAWLFGRWRVRLTVGAPNWLKDPLSGRLVSDARRTWWQIPDFDPTVGDIKLIWEFSRLDWVLALTQRVRNGDEAALDRLNAWLADWSMRNPPYLGPNWKCGQEASIRVMHLACAALVVGQVREATAGLRDLVALHLQRIAPTLQYAMAQDNNHGTSEAAALFIGGSWLAVLGDARGAGWASAGRRWLENRARRLIGEQGTFSQYSLNYHRVMLDTFSFVECWRRALGLTAFSADWNVRALAATRWLHALTDPITGDGPNVGANDGARLVQLADTPYRDYRPSVQLAMVLFARQRAYAPDGPWNQALNWLGVDLPEAAAQAPGSLQADDGGFMVMRRGAAMALLRYPRFRFRPSQADALHVDFWVAGQACLRDAGTYSYNTEPKWLDYFGGVSGHNTVQFDDRDQMPRLSRFLLGDWLRTERLESLHTTAEGVVSGAGYRDRAGASHHRRVTLNENRMVVVDQVEGFSCRAVLRWRLVPGDWHQETTSDGETGFCHRVTGGNGHTLTLRSSARVSRCEIVEGWESLHYLEKTPAPVLELEVTQPATLTTEYLWTA
jgi:hypothetical protein